MIETFGPVIGDVVVKTCAQSTAKLTDVLKRTNEHLARLHEEVIAGPARRKVEMSTAMEKITDAACSGQQIISNDGDLLRFCKLCADTSVEPTKDLNQPRSEFLKSIEAVINRSFEKMQPLINAAKSQLAATVYHPSAIDALVEKYKTWIYNKFIETASTAGTGYYQCFNVLNNLIGTVAQRLARGNTYSFIYDFENIGTAGIQPNAIEID